jgi:cytosine deaminase
LDLRIRSVSLPDRIGLHDLLVDAGRIVGVHPTRTMPDGHGGAGRLVDGGGYLAVEAAVDGHLHLDKSLAGAAWQSLPLARDWREKSRIGEQLLLSLLEPSLDDRMLLQAQRLIDCGTVAARTHATVTVARGLSSVEATLRLRDRLAGTLDLQVVAFPQYGTSEHGMAELLEAAMGLGADVVGGNDPATYDRDIEGQLRAVFGTALAARSPVDIHLHDGGHLGLFEIKRVCAWVVGEGLQGRAAISHALALGELEPDEITPTLELLATADVAVIVPGNPDVEMAPLGLLDAAGVRAGLGSDAAHSVLPFGTGDMLRKANLVAQRAIITSDDGLERLWARVTRDTAGILGREPIPVAAGSPATFVLVKARNVAEAVASPPRDRVTFVNGRHVGSMGEGARLVA